MSPVPARSAPVAVIAGACGGIGRAVAQHLAADGMRLALWDINARALDALAAELRDSGAEAHALSLIHI